MSRVCPIKPVVSIAAAQDKFGSAKFSQFILDRLQRKKAQTGKFSHIEFLPRIGKQKPEHLRSDDREQRMQKRSPHRYSDYSRPL